MRGGRLFSEPAVASWGASVHISKEKLLQRERCAEETEEPQQEVSEAMTDAWLSWNDHSFGHGSLDCLLVRLLFYDVFWRSFANLQDMVAQLGRLTPTSQRKRAQMRSHWWECRWEMHNLFVICSDRTSILVLFHLDWLIMVFSFLCDM